MSIIDAHAHLTLRRDGSPDGSGALLATMDACGIERAVVVAGGTIAPAILSAQIENGGGSDIDVDNAAVLRACERASGRLLPFYFANPHRGDAEYAREGDAFFGLKLGPAVHGVTFDDPRTHALVARAESFGHAIYLHCLTHAGSRVADFVALAEAFPGVRFILGHAGVGNCDFAAVARIAPLANVWFEMSGGFSSVCKAAVKTLGAARVLFGTEYPLQDPRVELAKLTTLDLTPAEHALVTRGNVLRLLARARTPEAAITTTPNVTTTAATATTEAA